MPIKSIDAYQSKTVFFFVTAALKLKIVLLFPNKEMQVIKGLNPINKC